MNILVVGLGLIGGSVCKALKKYTTHTVTGCDINKDIQFSALRDVAVDYEFEGDYSGYDLIIVSLFPEAAENFIRENIASFSKECLLTDVCGIKGSFSERIKKLANDNGVRYLGMHPMAGKEFGGYANSSADLFQKANFIIAADEDSKPEDVEILRSLSVEIGAGKVVVTTPADHDKMIAYTSQLAHIVSSAYVKSPELKLECGFSGGSFQDMTRIATMNEKMWTDLFMQNRENLMFELDTLIGNLMKYSEALKNSDSEEMLRLIAEGRQLKEDNLRHRVGQPS
ncbi:MAG: prephenate dehydrogenase [Ruminococcus sp.]|nr:prephenate dehydrogenase [Ruminococcus sp.]